MASRAILQVAKRSIPVSNLEKVLYPATGFRKADVIEFYGLISPVLLPHLKGRAITLKRYPDGVHGKFFYEKNSPEHRPEWVKTAEIWSESRDTSIHYSLLGDLPSLVWAANLGSLELHPFLAKAAKPARPTAVVFDLDPGAPADLVDCCRAGVLLCELLAAVGLQSFAKTSGSKGLQLYVPLNTPATFEQTKRFAHAVALRLERDRPGQFISRMHRAAREGKVLVDWSQNDEHKTTVAVYSLRARDLPTVSTPVSWDEVRRCAKSGRGGALVFQSREVVKRVQRLGDLFAPLLSLRQRLPDPESLAARSTSAPLTARRTPRTVRR